MNIQKPMLASAIKDIKGISYPILCTPKLDGIRCLVTDEGAVSRNFKPIPNGYIRGLISKLPVGFDGEIMLDNSSFQAVTSAVMSEDGEPDFFYAVFDYMKSNPDEPYNERMERLENIKTPSFVRKILPKLIKSEEELLKFEEKCLKEGYEGCMVRKPNGKYKFGRSSEREGLLLKLKRFADSEAVVLAVEEKLSNQNEAKRDAFGRTERSSEKAGMIPAGTLGSFRVKDCETGVEFSVGSGFDDAFRAEVWKNRNKYIGNIIKYKSQKIGEKIAPRFPVFIGLRHINDMS